MWRALILLGAVGVVFLVVLLTSGPSRDKSDDPNRIPPGYMQALGKLAAPFAPKLDLGAAAFELLPGSEKEIEIPASKEKSRTATLVLRRGSLVLVRFCPAGSADCSHNLPACLAAEGRPAPGNTGCMRPPSAKASVAAQSGGGTLTILAPTERATLAVE